jgi:hypothetical protein
MVCSKCESDNIIKYGKTKDGDQRYRCKDCLSIFKESPSFTWLNDSEKSLIINLKKNNFTSKEIASYIQKTPSCIEKFLCRIKS